MAVTDITTPGMSEPWINVNEEVIHILLRSGNGETSSDVI